MNLEDVLLRGTRAAQPAATSVAEGQLYSVTNEGYIVEQSRGGIWLPYAGSGGSSSSGGQIANFPFFPDLQEVNDEPFVLPTPIPAPVAVGGGGAWTLLHTRSVGAGAGESFTTGLNYNEILVCTAGAVCAGAASLQLVVSTDGGASYLTTSGNYKSFSSTGVEGDSSSIQLTNSGTTSPQTSYRSILNFNGTTTPKLTLFSSNTSGEYRVNTTSVCNALRVQPSGGNFNSAGTIYIYGR